MFWDAELGVAVDTTRMAAYQGLEEGNESYRINPLTVIEMYIKIKRYAIGMKMQGAMS